MTEFAGCILFFSIQTHFSIGDSNIHSSLSLHVILHVVSFVGCPVVIDTQVHSVRGGVILHSSTHMVQSLLLVHDFANVMFMFPNIIVVINTINAIFLIFLYKD